METYIVKRKGTDFFVGGVYSSLFSKETCECNGHVQFVADIDCAMHFESIGSAYLFIAFLECLFMDPLNFEIVSVTGSEDSIDAS